MAKGHALTGLGRYTESLPYFDQALAINPEFQDALIYKGMTLYLSGRFDEAMDIEAFQREFTSRFKQELQEQNQSPSPR